MEKHKIIIVDDHQLVSNSLKKLVESYEDFLVLQQLCNGKELVDYFAKESALPDLLLLDVRMPVMDGKETIAWLKSNIPSLKVLILTMEDDEETIIYMLKMGARGYILKDIEPNKFKEAIYAVLNTGYYHTELISKALISDLTASENDKLSQNELTFLEFACTDLTYKEIAAKMFLSPKTIDNYRESLFKKLCVKNRIGLAMYAIKHHIVKL